MDPFNSQTGELRGSGSSIAVVDCPNAKLSKKYASWRDAKRRTFITACETTIVEGHRHGKCFTKHGWESVVTLFNSISGDNWSKLQLHNHWDAWEYKRLTKLLTYTGVEYNPSNDRIVASDKWWSRKLKENKEYNDFKDNDASEIYVRYRQLFGDSYDGDKYAVTPTKLYHTGFSLLEDSAVEDQMDTIPVDEESIGSSDEENEQNCTSSMGLLNARSDEKKKSASSTQKGKKKKVSARELSFLVDRANSAAEEVAAKINTIMAPMSNVSKNAGVACVEELLAAGRLERRTPLYFFACKLRVQKRYRDMLGVMRDTDEKFEWIEWQFNERNKYLH